MRGLALVLALAGPARAAKTESTPAQTYWDRIMEAQALRDMREGAVALESKRYEEALKYLARAAVQTPTDPMAHKMLGTAYYWTGRVDLAETEFKEALKLGPDAQGHLLLGIVQAWKGENEPALASFLKAAEFDPTRADIQMNVGSIEEGRGRYQDALERFRRAVELDGQHPLYRFQLGMAFKRLGRDEEAASELRQAIKLFSGYQDAILELGSLEEHAGRQSASKDLFEKAVRLKERDAVARFRLARLLLASGRKDKARDVLRGVFRLTPADTGGGLALAVAYGGTPPPASAQHGKPSDAPEPEPGAGGALDVVSRNLARVPLDQEAVLEVNLAFVSKPKLVKKVKDEGGSLRRALEAAGKVPEQPASGGHKEYQLPAGSREERRAAIGRVLEDLKKTLAQAPADAETRVGMNLRFSERSAAAAGGDAAGKAKVSYQPRDVGNDLGLWVMGTGWMGLIEEVLEEAAPSGADSDLWDVVVGIGYSALGDAGTAAAAFERALAKDPGSELAYLGRGVAMVIRGDEKGAIEAYKKAISINPKNKAAAEGLEWLLRAPTTEEAAR
ncbi:MAG: tetratricopeptide repeat protein [Elusimicrobia bacterium]|nr:tetratricopeptide repeat protein [Elusimicrobiota bacterium]